MAGILLVHGAWHGPWCWDNLAGHLTAQGQEVRAVRLRDHDQPRHRLWHRVRHYVEDVKEAVVSFSDPPVLVGHSIGGLVVQKYLEHNPAPGAVLIASVPTGGSIGAVARQAVRHPLLLLKSTMLLRLSPFVSTPELVRELFFTPNTPENIVSDTFARLQDESYFAFLDTMLVLARPRRVRTPMLVIGAGRDAIFTIEEVQRTASAYRTEAEIFTEMGHDMMLDERWPELAERIDAWVRERASVGTEDRV
jgi:pimeloyl-ACP methyl ester carboxylesterase